jgi:hypothetical protein
LALRFFGFGMGVTNSAGRRVWWTGTDDERAALKQSRQPPPALPRI